MTSIGLKACVLGLALGFAGCVSDRTENSELQLAREGKTAYAIVHASDCQPAERYAAQELSDYLHEMTGATFPVVDETQAPRTRRIVVGPCELSRRLLDKETVEKLESEEIVVRTSGCDLVLVGGSPRGTLYAAYHLLDNVLGVRWWAADATFVPRKPELNIPALNILQEPAFATRGELHFVSAWNQDWSAHNRVNRMCYATWDPGAPAATTVSFTIDEKHGGGILYPMPGQKNCHTFYAYLPAEKYFDAHPDWFAEINGKRVRNSQPCLSNPDVLKVVTEAVLEDLRQNPGATMVNVSQIDGSDNYCRCDKCRKIDEEEGSGAGTLLRFVNAVAEQVEKVRPDVLVETLAYLHTRPAPKLTRPRANVAVRLCNFGACDFMRAFDAPVNAKILDNLRDWSSISPHLFFWDYMLGYLRPYPNLRTIGPNLRVLAQQGVKGCLIEGSHFTAAEFDELRTWLLSRLLWNPFQDDQALIAEFVHGYYGPAGQYVLKYINLIHDAAIKGNCQLFQGGDLEPSPFVNYDVMLQAESFFRQAEQAVASQADLLRRVRRTHMAVQYVWTLNREEWAAEARQRGQPPPPPAAEFYEALRRQALVEKDGAPKNRQRQIDGFLATTEKELELAPLKLSIKASKSYATQPYMAFDGDPNTAWNPGGPGPEWIQRDLGRTVSVKSIRTDFGYLYTNVTYQIEASQDGQVWTPMIGRKTAEGCLSEDRTDDASAARFVRTTIFSAASRGHPQGEWLGIAEQEIVAE
ncbi:MAG: DUF4838 domain-containing protein [Kiritimatiellae bacterium]|nr:DUF4838 domain-containing protein [Kiritimatiellia bacterium]